MIFNQLFYFRRFINEHLVIRPSSRTSCERTLQWLHCIDESLRKVNWSRSGLPEPALSDSTALRLGLSRGYDSLLAKPFYRCGDVASHICPSCLHHMRNIAKEYLWRFNRGDEGR
ncbi:hypothetical protein Q1695_001210 [Nippostrongylus brasiliensis]|nr:hypothetical protein Q1695_001210 [Nippostrongylus brasiliensis]